MQQVLEFNDIRQLDAYRLLWKSLWQQTRGASFFQTLDWLETYWRHFGGAQRLRVLLVRFGRELLGILPLAELTERTWLGPVTLLTYPLVEWGLFFGPIGPHPAATLHAAIRHLARHRSEWDVVDLRGIDPRVDAGRTALAMRMAGLRVWDGPWVSVPRIDVSRGWRTLLGGRTAEIREWLDRAESLARTRGGLVFERYRPRGAMFGEDDARWESWEHECNGQRSAAPARGTGCGPEDFLQAAHRAAARCGALDVALLRLNGRPLALGYSYMSGRVLSGVHVCSAADDTDLHPARLLLAHTLRDSCQRGDKALVPRAAWLPAARGWSSGRVTSVRCSHFARDSARGQLLRLSQWHKRQSTV